MSSTKWVIIIIAVIIVVGLVIWYYSKSALPGAPIGGLGPVKLKPGEVVGPTGQPELPPPGVQLAPSREPSGPVPSGGATGTPPSPSAPLPVAPSR